MFRWLIPDRLELCLLYSSFRFLCMPFQHIQRNYFFGANTENCFNKTLSLADIEELLDQKISKYINQLPQQTLGSNTVTIVREKILQPQYISTPGKKGEKGDNGTTTIVYSNQNINSNLDSPSS